MLRGGLVHVGTTFLKSASIGPHFPASLKAEVKASQLPDIYSSNTSLTFLMTATARQQVVLDSTSCVAIDLGY